MVRLLNIILVLFLHSVAAFTSPRRTGKVPSKTQDTFSKHHTLLQHRDTDCTNLNAAESSDVQENSSDAPTKPQWTHSDIEWRLAPDPEMPMFEKLQIKAGAKALHAELTLTDQPIPPVLCPKGGKCELQAYKDGKQIAKFGITTKRGPSAPPIDETIADLYDIRGYQVGIAAIIYMFVEPEYRGLGIGSLALEAAATIQTVQGCDFTVLVADDNGSGKLIKWYEMNDYKQAPKLQTMFGSPDGKFGITMIRPTEVRSDIFAHCQIKWW